MTTTLSEDDIYRTSTQYRLWSFSPEKLAAQRRKTHDIAIERAQRYAKQRPPTNGANGDSTTVLPNGTSDNAYTDFLTEEEEARLIQRYSDQIRSTSDHFKWPINVKATAVQYLKRFYLSNSCITYPPKEIYKTVLFLACKTEATHMTLSEYARRISTEVEAVLAPEYKVMQALRFTLEVHQPFRGLKGVLMEMSNLAEGLAGGEGEMLQGQMLGLPPSAPGEGRTQWTAPASGEVEVKHLHDRINAAYAAARTLLDAPALLTDVYFLYTPSQILLASMHLADPVLTSFYLSTKLAPAASAVPTTTTTTTTETSDPTAKILTTIHTCASHLASFSPEQVLSKDSRAQLEEKLERCRDPGTRDLVKAFAALRQDGVEDGKVDEDVAKRRREGRERNLREGEELFGPRLEGGRGGEG